MINSISIVFPLYNEENRLYMCFKDIISFNRISPKIKKEYIFVSDGSTDNSVKKIKEFIKASKNRKSKTNYKIISLAKNLGKGGALRTGVLKAKNKWILTMDIDIAVSLEQIIIWDKKKFITRNVNEIYFGSRRIFGSQIKRIKSRHFAGLIMIFFLMFFLKIRIFDTQCGFKLYEKNNAKKLFKSLSEFGYIHDVEIVLLSQKSKILIRELPIKWTHKKDGKINVIYDSVKMFFNIIMLKKKYQSLIRQVH